MGLSSKKSSTTSASTGTTSGTATTTPNAPSWITDIASSLGARIPNTTATVPGASGLQQDAFDSLSGQNFGAGFNTAATNAGASSAVGSADEGVNHWLNTFLPGVVDATSADLDASDGQTRAQQTLDLARNNAFGGSGSALTRSMTEGELSRARATTLGNLRMGAYDAAAGNSQQDSQRALQSKIADQQAAQAQAQLMLQALGLQADLGGQQRTIAGQQGGADLANLSAQLGLFGQLPLDQLYGSTVSTNGTTSSTGSGTATTNDPFGSLTGLLGALPKAPK